MPTMQEVHRAYQDRLAGIDADSFRAFYEIMVVRFILITASIPFALGAILAYHQTGVFDWPVFLVGSLTVFLIMAATNAGNTYFDYETDSRNDEFSAYSGGIRVLVEGKIADRRRALWFAFGLLALALPLGLSLYFLFHTGTWTIPLGFFGALCGWFYTGKPLKLVYRGLGEVIIAVCAGMLTVICGYYLQSGRFTWALLPLALGLTGSILNVILINEFADRRTDALSGKRTWLVRLGTKRAARLYLVNQVWSLAAVALAPLFGLPWYAAALSLTLALPTAWRNRRRILEQAYQGDGINSLTLDTFAVHLALEVGFALTLLIGGLARWI
ncbi:MAG: prenyltransferase [Chloroflexota bacterium]|nr:prenyltransferase [Chloroflexota bacterium]